MIKLLWKGDLYAQKCDRILIGANETCDFVIDADPGVQYLPFEISKVGNRWLAQSKTAFPIKVFGKPDSSMVWLNSGDVILLGDHDLEVHITSDVHPKLQMIEKDFQQDRDHFFNPVLVISFFLVCLLLVILFSSFY